ncbi:MAG: HWE histidine kinase domain-containing protein, partial [Pararhizobium sp.]
MTSASSSTSPAGKIRAAEAGESIGLLDRVVKKTGAGYIFQSEALDIILSGNLPDRLSGLLSENGDIDVLGDEDGNRLLALKRTVFDTAEDDCMEVEIPSSAGLMTFRIDVERITTHGTDGILSVITDISETRHRERVLKTLLRELSHRSKNLLAIIQGIATQTARQALSLENFMVKFRGRIQSL